MISEKTLNALLAVGVVVALVVLGVAIFSPPQAQAPVMQQEPYYPMEDVETVSSSALSIITTNGVNISMGSTPVNANVVMPGEYVTYTIVVSNTSAEILPTYDVTALIPSGTVYDSHTSAIAPSTTSAGNVVWQLSSLGAGSSVTLGYRIRIGNLPSSTARLVINNFATLHIAPTATSTEGTKNSSVISHIIEAYEK